MSKAPNAAYYNQKGREAYQAGIVKIFGDARSWQQKAFQDGYKQARKDWQEKYAEAVECESDVMTIKRFVCAKGVIKAEQNAEKSVQDIFDIVIANELYVPKTDQGKTSRFMCHALNRAAENGLIEWEDVNKAKDAIEYYMRCILESDCSALETALKDSNLPHTFKDCMEIYTAWAMKPGKRIAVYIKGSK